MIPVEIDEQKCIGCALCAMDCPNGCLCIEGGKARTKDGTRCISCGHCFAICPQAAISIKGAEAAGEPAVPMTEIEGATLLAAIKSRRSIRRFSARPVEGEKLAAMLEAGRYAPTGSNAQNVAYTILGSKQAEAERACVALFRKGKRLGAPLSRFLRTIEIPDDFFFKGAPLVIVVSSKSALNAGLASAYMELVANSLGLGVLYSGFFVACARMSKGLQRLLKLPKGHEPVSCMAVGYTDIKYRRIPPRKPLQARTL